MPKSLVPLAATLAVLSVVSFVLGASMLGAGVLMSSSIGGGPEKPGYEDGHPVGLYLMTRYWMATGSLEKALYYFTSDGRVYVDLEDGFADDVLAKHKGRHGTVKMDGDEMVVTWQDGKDARAKLEKGNGGFNWDMGLFAPVEPFEDDKALAGKWEGGSSVHFSGSSTLTSTTLELHDDGTFSGESLASFRSESDESVATGGSQGNHAGTWKLDGYSLVLTYADGRTVRGIAFPFDDEKTPVYPDRFYFAGTMYKKEG